MFRIYKCLVVLMLLLMVCAPALAQKSKTDSLKKVIAFTQANQGSVADTNMVILKNELAHAYIFNNPDSTFIVANQALALSSKLNYQKGRLISLRFIALSYDIRGNYTLAFRYLFNALNLSEQANDEQQVIACLHDIINIYIVQNDLEQANVYLNKIFNLYKKNKREPLLLEVLSIRAAIHTRQNKLTTALNDLFQMIKVSKVASSSSFGQFSSRAHTIAFTYNDIGNIYVRQHRYTQAIPYYIAAVKYYEHVNDVIGRVDTYGFLAEAYYKNKNYKTALIYSQKSYNLCRGKKLLRSLREITQTIYPIYAATGQYKLALKFHVLFKAYSDSVFNQGKIKEVGRLEAKYEFDKQQIKEQAAQSAKDEINKRMYSRQLKIIAVTLIALILSLLATWYIYKSRQSNLRANHQLQLKNDEIKHQAYALEVQAGQLKDLNQVKNKLFSIIAHDLRSPLVSFIQMLKMVEDDSVSGEDLKGLIPQMMQDASSTSMLLENLLMWANSQMNGFTIKKEIFDLHEVVNNNTMVFEGPATEKNIKIKSFIDSKLNLNTDKNIIDLVLRNLVANALKFTPSGGSITIYALKTEDEINIQVTDTGIGLSADAILKLFGHDMHSNRGTANEKGTGLGLKICKEFIEAIGGRIWVNSELGKGSTFTFSVPL